MPDSCCKSCTGSIKAESIQQDQKSIIEPTIHDKDTGSCCQGSTCGCDDSCIEQLARAICADDDGHIHTSTDSNHSITVVGTHDDEAGDIDADSTGTCKCEDIPPSASDMQVNVHSCGLRKRTVKATKESHLPKEACGEHKSIARTRQMDTLAAFGCICKAMLARGLQSCCSTHLGGKVGPIASSASGRGSLVKKGRSSLDSSSNDIPRVKYLQSVRSKRISSKVSLATSSCCGDSCCGGKKDNPRVIDKSTSSLSIDSCCGNSCCGGKDKYEPNIGDVSESISVDSCCGDSCCVKEKNTTPSRSKSRIPVDSCVSSCCGKSIVEADADIEKQALGSPQDDFSTLNHAVLAIKGMTCTGCENKLIKALHAIPTICHVRTSLVLARAEFDYSGGVGDLVSLIQTIKKRTGFSAEHVELASTRALELTVEPALMEKVLFSPYPDGVQDVVKVTKDTIRVLHIPHIIGARDIISAYVTFSPVLAPEPKDPALAAGMKHIRMLGLRTILSALLTIPVLIITWAPLPDHHRVYAIISLALATIVQTVIAGPFYQSAFKSLFFSRIIETDLLIVLSTTTAYVYSVVAFAFDVRGHPLTTGEFFETSTLLVTLIMVGQLVSAFARQRAIEAISLRSLQQNTATLIHPDGREEDVDGRLLQYGDTFKVPPDSSIITDGTVTQGQSEVDESMMTGESLPVFKKVGSTVVAGTANGPSTLYITVTRLPGENTISDIANMVDDARFSRARVQETVDLVCGWFVPVVLVLTIITFVIWIAVGMTVRNQTSGQAAVTAITYAIAVLAISCPCAIGLAVPMVILVASGVGAKVGLVFKSATTIEGAWKIRHVVFDKTGTLTQGRLTVVKSTIPKVEGVDTVEVIMGLVSASQHPVARAVAKYLGDRGTTASKDIRNVQMVTGKGVQGFLNGEIIRGGSACWLELEEDIAVRPLLSEGLTTFCVIYKDQFLGVFALSDTLRPEASFVISRLLARKIEVSILSGDHAAAVDRVAEELGIPKERVRSGCLPVDKQAYIRELSKQQNKVLFCGDGTNDAIALAQADIGVHMSSASSSPSGSGSGIAASTAADVVLIHPSLTGILNLLELSEAVNRRIVLNFVWSAVYNLVAILFAAGAFVNARIAPAYAGLGEVVSVVPVVMVALQLKWFKAGV